MMVTAGGGSQRGISGGFFLVHISPACQEESNDVAVPLERCVIGGTQYSFLSVHGNLATTYLGLGRNEEALCSFRDAYLGFLKLYGKEHQETLRAAFCYATTLIDLQRHSEAKELFRKIIPVARRVLGESYELTLRLRWVYARALFEDADATLDHLREAVTTLEDTEQIARRVLGGTHPTTEGIVMGLRLTRAALRAREGTPSGGA